MGLDTGDSVIWVCGIAEEPIKAFTDDGVEEFKSLLEMHRENPGLFE